VLAIDTDVWADDTWLIDSTPVECGRSRPTDKGYTSTEFETRLAGHGIELIRPARRNEPPRPGARQLKPLPNRPVLRSLTAYDHRPLWIFSSSRCKFLGFV